jgi:hypothetical protein
MARSHGSFVGRAATFVSNLETGHERRLTNLGPEFVIDDFDVSPDGKEIVFDREQDSSDVVLIER